MTTTRFPALIGLLFGALAAAVSAQEAAEAPEPAARGDAAWARRAKGHDAGAARPEPVTRAIEAYERALEANPDDTATRIKLLRAVYFLGEYATPEKQDKVAVFERGRDAAEAAIDRLTAGFDSDPRPRWDKPEAHRAIVRHFDGNPDAAGIYLWAANHWALWGRYRGPIPAARQGAANKIRDYALVVISLDRSYDRAGGYRVLGRLHHEAPKVPFVTGWIDRDTGLETLTRAVKEAPDDLLNRLYWIEAVYEHDRSRREEAIVNLRELAAREPDPEFLIEELNVVINARELLAKVDK